MIEEYSFSDVKTSKDLNKEKGNLVKQGAQLQGYLVSLLPVPEILMKMIALAKDVKKRNQAMADTNDEKDAFVTEYREKFEKTLESFHRRYLKNQMNEVSKVLGNSGEMAADSCA